MTGGDRESDREIEGGNREWWGVICRKLELRRGRLCDFESS